MTAVSEDYLAYIVERLEGAGAVRVRRMFGGAGLYLDDAFFAIIDDNTLYFKVDDSNRSDYESAGMTPFRPFGDDAYSMNYYVVPEEILEDDQRLRQWAVKAVSVAQRKRKTGDSKKKEKHHAQRQRTKSTNRKDATTADAARGRRQRA